MTKVVNHAGVDYSVVNNGVYVSVDKVPAPGDKPDIEGDQMFFAQGDEIAEFDNMTAEEVVAHLTTMGVL